ncbi:TPA: lysogeny establishment protein [Escherichia coli]
MSFRSTERQTPRMADIDSISVASPVKSIRSAEHFVMNATEEEARRGFAKVMSEFGEFLGHVDKALSISSARSKALTASMLK